MEMMMQKMTMKVMRMMTEMIITGSHVATVGSKSGETAIDVMNKNTWLEIPPSNQKKLRHFGPGSMAPVIPS